MRKISLKLKLTILYTFFMLLVIGLTFAILFSLSSKEILTSAQMKLKEQVQESMDDIKWEDGTWKPDSDFYMIEGGVYLSLYDKNNTFLYGKIPYDFPEQSELLDGKVNEITDGGKVWYVYDLPIRLEGGGDIYIRGIISATEAEQDFQITLRFAVILLPIMAAVMAMIVYRMTRRTLLPVKKMTQTVQKIRQDTDLSRRIPLQEKREKGRQDEVTYLAWTFNEMLEEVEKAFQREKQFTSDVSHELRTPVSVILAQCEACIAEEHLTKEQEKQLKLIQKKAREMAEMISHLLLLSRAEQGRQKIQPEQVWVSELLEIVVEEQRLLAREKAITITANIEPNLYAMLDETLYIRMIVNLISNGITYGKQGGRIEVSLVKKGEELIGTVRDNGIGIRKENLPHIWERFYREDKARSEGSHSGLGLSMVKWIVEAHRGWIRVESEVGKGTVFTYGFPITVNSD